jgi:hypothetical protein
MTIRAIFMWTFHPSVSEATSRRLSRIVMEDSQTVYYIALQTRAGHNLISQGQP